MPRVNPYLESFSGRAMILSMSDQAWLFLTTVAAGFVMGFVYDIFRIIRRTIPHRQWIVQIEDIIYWTSCSLLMFIFLLHENYGEIRFFSIVGAALGMILYFISLSPLFLKVSVTLIMFLQKVVMAVARILLTPVRWLIKLLTPPLKWMLAVSRKNTGHIKRAGKGRLRRLRRSILVMMKKV